jgi:subtilisin family serine protease
MKSIFLRLSVGTFLFSQFIFASVPALRAQTAPDSYWHLQDPTENSGVQGVSSTRSYKELVKGKTPKPIIVAVIDSGTETNHPDLQPKIWTNKKEIPDNSIDDDKNGYVDDVHGWSFIGGKKGDVEADNLEFTRIYKGLKKRFEGKTETDIAAVDKADYQRFKKMSDEYKTRMEKAKESLAEYRQFYGAFQAADAAVKSALGKDKYSVEDLQNYNPTDEMGQAFKQILIVVKENNLEEQFPDWKNQVEGAVKYSYNLEYDPRDLVGDDYSNPNEKYYGNNHIDGPHAEHGTHVAGIIGAVRGNEGVDGICESCELMIIRAVPDGDERDKDVANAIRYAVDNGAKVINMSFGKSYSPEKNVVDEAVKYAESKGVILVHAAGNDGKVSTKDNNFPNADYLSGGVCSTWIEVGASGPNESALAADFSNYNPKHVDLFAPGVDIYSTVPGKTYKNNSGTSMASPVTAGVVAAMWSYFPDLSAQRVREIIIKSAEPHKSEKVPMPGNEKKKVKFKKLSRTGAVVNLYNAIKMASAS